MSEHPFTYVALCRALDCLSATHPFIRKSVLGKSLFKTPIPALVIGCGRKKTVYVGCHHGSEYLTAFLLLSFAEELAKSVDAGIRRFSLDTRTLIECRTAVIIPCLNPDGMRLACEGADAFPDHTAALTALNQNSRDFSRWQANGRGVDLNHNYDFGFFDYKALEKQHGIRAGATRFAGEYPESEPETRALASYLRKELRDLSAVLSFHSQGEVIYYHDTPITRRGARFLRDFTGYSAEHAEGLSAYGGLTDYLHSLKVPAYTLEIGKGENPLPSSLFPYLYASLREALFRSLSFF
ncbi:MAG: hypothetical protein IKC63_07630 [Clostridia bacterium]|nr:hypothetical protein [Clostridia bacterium]